MLLKKSYKLTALITLLMLKLSCKKQSDYSNQHISCSVQGTKMSKSTMNKNETKSKKKEFEIEKIQLISAKCKVSYHFSPEEVEKFQNWMQYGDYEQWGYIAPTFVALVKEKNNKNQYRVYFDDSSIKTPYGTKFMLPHLENFCPNIYTQKKLSVDKKKKIKKLR